MGWADKGCLKEEEFISRKREEAEEMGQVVAGAWAGDTAYFP